MTMEISFDKLQPEIRDVIDKQLSKLDEILICCAWKNESDSGAQILTKREMVSVSVTRVRADKLYEMDFILLDDISDVALNSDPRMKKWERYVLKVRGQKIDSGISFDSDELLNKFTRLLRDAMLKRRPK